MAYPKAKLGNIKLIGSDVARWTLRDGVEPVIETFDVMPKDAETLLEGGPKPITLTLGNQEGKQLVVENLYVIGEEPASSPHIRRIKVADRRIWWEYPLILRRFNIRRRTGDLERIDGGGLPGQIKPIAKDVWYAPWSTFDGDGGSPWTPFQVLEDVLKLVLEREKKIKGGGTAGFHLDKQSLKSADSVPIEGLQLDVTGGAALSQVLRSLPQVAITVEKTGRVLVYSRIDSAEERIISGAGPESVGRGHVQEIKKHRVRPSEINVYFSREIEVRFDFTEDASLNATKVKEDKDARKLDNVLPVPDFELQVGNRKVAQGTYLPLVDAMTAWNASGGIQGWGKFDLWYVRRAMVPFFDLWASPKAEALSDPNNDWLGRFSAVEQHYRQTYQINRRWRDRIYSLRAYRVGVIDSETGIRAPAPAYGNYCRIGTARSVRAGNGEYCKNIQGYPVGGVIGSGTKAIPARVSVPDSDQGIIRLDFLADTLRMYNVTLPSFVTNQGSGRAGPANRLRDADVEPIGFDALPKKNVGNYPQLAASHKVAVIVTAQQGAPNDLRQLHKITVKPNDIANLLPFGVRDGLTNALGPPMDVRVGATPETSAMVRWQDSAAKRVEQAFGIGGKPDEHVDLTDLTINADANVQSDKPLNAIARAVAAALYASYSDRLAGEMEIKIAADIRLGGWLGEVSFSVSTKGEVSTKLRLREGGPSLDFMALLPASVQSMMMRLVQIAGAG